MTIIGHETATLVVVVVQAIGTITAIARGIYRIEKRFQRLETAILIIMNKCPQCPQTLDHLLK